MKKVLISLLVVLSVSLIAVPALAQNGSILPTSVKLTPSTPYGSIYPF